MRRENAKGYNAIVREYDKLNGADAIELMEKEVATLKPHLQKIKGRNSERWKTALAASGVKIPKGHQLPKS
jgi:hypothetical protein